MNIEQIRNAKILNLETLTRHIEGLKIKGEQIVFTNGCFDIIHSGHIHTLSEAKALGTKLIVAINSDSSVKRLKGSKRPILSEDERALIVAALSFVDFVILFNEDTPFNLIKNLKPNILVKGGDYKINEIVGADIVLENGGSVEMIPFMMGFSTTNTIEKIIKGH